MSYLLIKSRAFERNAKKLIRKNPAFAQSLKETLSILSENPFEKRLWTHKLKGIFEGFWACSCGYDIRIIFGFEKQKNENTNNNEDVILLYTIGTHDEVY